MFDPCWSTVSLVLWTNLRTLVSVPEQASNSRPESADASSVWYFTSGANSDEIAMNHVFTPHERCVYQQLGTWSRLFLSCQGALHRPLREPSRMISLVTGKTWEIETSPECPPMSTYVHLCPHMSTYVHLSRHRARFPGALQHFYAFAGMCMHFYAVIPILSEWDLDGFSGTMSDS